MKKTTIQTEVLTCPSCVKKIETALQKTAGVDSVSVLFNSSKVKIEYDENVIEVLDLKRTISNLGFEVLSSKES